MGTGKGAHAVKGQSVFGAQMRATPLHHPFEQIHGLLGPSEIVVAFGEIVRGRDGV
jgi:hypothetical protein